MAHIFVARSEIAQTNWGISLATLENGDMY